MITQREGGTATEQGQRLCKEETHTQQARRAVERTLQGQGPMYLISETRRQAEKQSTDW